MDQPKLRIARAEHTPLHKRNADVAWTPPRPANASRNGPESNRTTDRSLRFFQALIANRLEGGRAAILSPEHRQSLLAAGASLRLRPFDTALMIAAVQDRARRGEDPLDPNLLPFTPKRDRTPPSPHPIYLIATITLTLASALTATAIAWISA